MSSEIQDRIVKLGGAFIYAIVLVFAIAIAWQSLRGDVKSNSSAIDKHGERIERVEVEQTAFKADIREIKVEQKYISSGITEIKKRLE